MVSVEPELRIPPPWPRATAELALRVQLLTASDVPSALLMPPPNLAELPLSVLLTIVTVALPPNGTPLLLPPPYPA